MYFADFLQQVFFSDCVVGGTECYRKDCRRALGLGRAGLHPEECERLVGTLRVEGEAPAGVGRETKREPYSGEESGKGFRGMKAVGEEEDERCSGGDMMRGERERERGREGGREGEAGGSIGAQRHSLW